MPARKRVLITGATGLLGRALWDVFSRDHQALAIGRQWKPNVPRGSWKKADLRDPSALRRIAVAFRPDVVLHAAAIPNIDQCEKFPREAFETNAQGTYHLIHALPRRDIPFVYISTDNIFDGRKRSGYREEDQPNPLNSYGLSKLWGERHVRSLCRKGYIVRTCWLFGNGPNFMTKLLAGEKLKAADDWRANPTYTVDLARAVLKLRKAVPGIYHLTNAFAVTRWKAVEVLKTVAGGRFEIRAERVRLRSLALAAGRPQNSALINSNWRKIGELPLRSWELALREFVGNWEKGKNAPTS
jgi:dTDP-4-dehydrorhamnose reductase